MSAGVATAVAAAEPPDRILTAASLSDDAPVWVWAFGRWRRGIVVARGRVRVRVRYAGDRFGGQKEKWFAATEAEPVYDGHLAEPVTYRCVTPRCRLQCTGRPGQTLAEVSAAHESSPKHYQELS